MARSWAFLVLLAFGVNGENFCARKGATSASSFCHPNRTNAYIECKEGRDVVSTCPDGLSWSLKIRACVNGMLSECAANFELKTKKAPASLCDTPPASKTGCAYSYRCYPDDASQFVICPPNTVYASIGRCPENRLFSMSNGKCLAERTTDCAHPLEGPEAGNIERSLVSFDGGSAGASSSLRGHGPAQAFELDAWKGKSIYPWANLHTESFPHTVWYNFPHAIEVAQFAFSSRDDGAPAGVMQSPTEFQLLGSNDCQAWNFIGDYRTTFTSLKQEKLWTIPVERRRSYKCYGVKVTKVTSGPYAAIQHLKFYT